MAERTVKVVITGDESKLSKALSAAGGKLDGFAGKAAKVGKLAALGLGAIAVGVAGIGVAAFKSADEFDQSMRQITGLVGIPKDEVDALRGSVLTLAGDTARAPKELADALFSITSAGFSGEEAMVVLDGAARAAAAGLGDTQSVALTVGSAVNAYGKEILGAGEATDILVGTVKAGNLSAEELSSSLGKILPIASSAGISLSDVGASVALITRNGATAGEAVTQMKSAITAMAAPNAAAQESLEGVGLSVEDLQKTMSEDGLLAALRQVETATGGNAVAMKQFFGSSEALSGALTILNGDAATVEGVFDDLKNTAGLTDAAFASASENAGFKMSQAFTKLKAAGIQLGAALAPLIGKLVDGLTPALDRLGPLMETRVIPALNRMGAFIATNIIPALTRFGGFIRTDVIPVLGQIGEYIQTRVVPAGQQLAQMFVTNVLPALGKVAAVVGDVIGWFSKLGTAVGGEGGGLAGIAKAVGDKIGEIGPVITAKLGELAVIAVEKLADLGRKFVEWVAPQIPPLLLELARLWVKLQIWMGTVALPALAAKLLEWGKAFVAWIVPAIPPMLLELGKLLVDLGAMIVDEGGPILVEKLGELAGFFADLPGMALEKLGALGAVLLTAGGDLIQGLWDGITGLFGGGAAGGGAGGGSTVTGWLAGLPAAAVGAIGSLLSTLLGAGTDLITGLFAGAALKMVTVGAWLIGLPAAFITLVGDLAKTLWNAGTALVGGLIGGIGEKLGALKRKVGEVLSALNPLNKVPGLGGGTPTFLEKAVGFAGASARNIGGVRMSGGPIPGPRGAPAPTIMHGGEFALSADVVDAIKRGDTTQGLASRPRSSTGGAAAGGGIHVAQVLIQVDGARDPMATAQATIDAFRKWTESNGPLPLTISS